MKEQTEQWVGIDVSKAYLDVYLHPEAKQWRSANTESGIAEIAKVLDSVEVALVVLEATGGMEQAVTHALSQAGIAVVVSNPRRVRDFAAKTGGIIPPVYCLARAMGKLAKTDRIDSEVLARFGRGTSDPVPPGYPSEGCGGLGGRLGHNF